MIFDEEDIEIQDHIRNIAFKRASTKGHSEIIKILIENGADINIRNNVGDIPLMIAVNYGFTEITKLLIKA